MRGSFVRRTACNGRIGGEWARPGTPSGERSAARRAHRRSGGQGGRHGGRSWRVVYTWPAPGGRIVRRRECLACGRRISTTEKVVGRA